MKVMTGIFNENKVYVDKLGLELTENLIQCDDD